MTETQVGYSENIQSQLTRITLVSFDLASPPAPDCEEQMQPSVFPVCVFSEIRSELHRPTPFYMGAKDAGESNEAIACWDLPVPSCTTCRPTSATIAVPPPRRHFGLHKVWDGSFRSSLMKVLGSEGLAVHWCQQAENRAEVHKLTAFKLTAKLARAPAVIASLCAYIYTTQSDASRFGANVERKKPRAALALLSVV